MHRLACSMNSLLSGKVGDAAAKIHWTVRCAPDCPVSRPCPRQLSAEQSAGDAWPDPTVTRPHRTVRCAKKALLQWSTSPEKKGDNAYSLSGGAPDCPVHPQTEGNYCLANGAPTAPICLGAIKGTPMHMEQDTKHLLNTIRRRDLAFAHLIHYDID
jgi:hypothetical protein